MREILRKQIREKDTMIDTLLAQLNPTATTATPLSLNTSRLALTQEQRNSYRDVLNYLEKSQGCGRAESRPKIDVSSLEDESDYEEEEEEGEALDDDEGFPGSLFQVHPLPTRCAPAGLLAKAALETRSRSRMSSPTDSAERSTDADSPEEGGIGNLAYFEPGMHAVA
ncbi:hypothetical protein PHLCEN_2v3322 [Hermanssonia centrifuga]|uniref:Uncharacterized protein n=1 Tax=Hermanssonia centrifuga TaxID=98765 RepID=A0A2R6QM78_9APHY|nr:hypothetical protein PHLCEN_2v3322 [Hermanssonia centrifuga]